MTTEPTKPLESVKGRLPQAADFWISLNNQKIIAFIIFFPPWEVLLGFSASNIKLSLISTRYFTWRPLLQVALRFQEFMPDCQSYPYPKGYL